MGDRSLAPTMERMAGAGVLGRMEMDVREIWDGLPFKIREAPLHLQRAERAFSTPQKMPAATERPQLIVIEPIAHRRTS